MEQYASPGLGQAPPSEAERERIRELSRYYCTLQHASMAPAEVLESIQKAGGPFLSKDTVLNGLTQLAVLRFSCARSFVSLIDGQNQHIIAETTSSISLVDKDKYSDDGALCLGVTTVDLAYGVCPDAMLLFTGQDVPALQNSSNMVANRTRFIVRDFTQESRFRDRPYVKEWPYFRFYAEVPIYSPSGYILGSFCIVDNKPRDFLDDGDIAVLQEISNSIAQHLENVRIVHYHQRSDRLIQGLTTFVKGRLDASLSSTDATSVRSSSRTATTTNLLEQAFADEQTVPVDEHSLSVEQLSVSEDTTNTQMCASTGPLSTVSTEMTSLSHQPQSHGHLQSGSDHSTTTSNPVEGDKVPSEAAYLNNAPQVTVEESLNISARVASIFSQACISMKDSMDLDGVCFVDASRCNAGIVHSTDSEEWEPFPTTVEPASKTSSFLPNTAEDSICDTLGIALGSSDGEHNPVLTEPRISESLLQLLTAAFPHGQVFNLDEAVDYAPAVDDQTKMSRRLKSLVSPGRSWKLDENVPWEVTSSLLRCFPGVKTLIYLPLWDPNEAQWLAGNFLWTSNKQRGLGVDELHYFKVFGSSVVSEVARVSWWSREKSKSNFISSLSHELRSPLHGMLASAELLSSSELREDQQEMVKMLNTCGLTLLDTMNHLLDFAKINNLASIENSPSPKIASSFNLKTLLEEVVDTLYLGSNYAAARHSATTPAVRDEFGGHRPLSNISVVVRVDHEIDWHVHSTVGAWRRIIMNVLGNALKYTDAGFIEVSLAQLPGMSSSGQVTTHVSITDSGRGMSAEFLRNKLFSPFAQEDYLSEGAGLGLSIVQQLVTVLDGSIDVRSELGIGTQVDIFIPVQIVPQPAPEPELTPQPPVPATDFCLLGFNAYSDLKETPTGTLSGEAKRRLCIQSFLSSLICSQAGWTASFAQTMGTGSGGVAIIEDPALIQPSDHDSGVSHTRTFNRYILLGAAASSPAGHNLARHAHVSRLSQPLCPQRVLAALRDISLLDETSHKPCVEPPAAKIDDQVSFDKEQTRPSENETPSLGRLGMASSVPNLLLTNEPLTGLDQPTPKDAASPGPEQVLHVLVVDDNPINIKVLSTFVRKLGWTFDTASNGLIALNKYKESSSSFDVVLMDISMPIMDGIASTAHIRAFEADNALTAVTIFAVTGVGSKSMKQQALAAGVNDYLIKPLSLQALKIAMRDI